MSDKTAIIKNAVLDDSTVYIRDSDDITARVKFGLVAGITGDITLNLPNDDGGTLATSSGNVANPLTSDLATGGFDLTFTADNTTAITNVTDDLYVRLTDDSGNLSSEKIEIVNTNGTGSDSIAINSVAGGLDVTVGDNVSIVPTGHTRIQQKYFFTVNTSTTTANKTASLSTASDTSYIITVSIISRDSDASDSVFFESKIAYENDSGTLRSVFDQQLTTGFKDASALNGRSVTFQTNGTDIEIVLAYDTSTNNTVWKGMIETITDNTSISFTDFV